MQRLLGFVLILPLVGWMGFRIVAGIQFDRNCEGYLKRAADSNTIDLAEKQLALAVDYAKREGLTEGFTSVLYRTPDEDVGFWFENLSSALDELRRVDPKAPQLERSNILMKLRETLLDSGSEGTTKVTLPEGISVFPYNVAFAIWATLGTVIALVGVVLILGDS